MVACSCLQRARQPLTDLYEAVQRPQYSFNGREIICELFVCDNFLK